MKAYRLFLLAGTLGALCFAASLLAIVVVSGMTRTEREDVEA